MSLHGSRLAAAALRAAGWQVRFRGLPALQGVIVVYPHTSNWDFVVGLLAKWAIGIPVKFWGKDSLFRWPLFGRWLKAVGGVPVDRSAKNGVVGDTVAQIEAARTEGRLFWLALAPEGTRGLTAGWRSGFYHVACQARVPLGVAAFDYGGKCIDVDCFLQLSGDAQADMAAVAAHLSKVRGCRPERAAPIRLRA